MSQFTTSWDLEAKYLFACWLLTWRCWCFATWSSTKTMTSLWSVLFFSPCSGLTVKVSSLNIFPHVPLCHMLKGAFYTLITTPTTCALMRSLALRQTPCSQDASNLRTKISDSKREACLGIQSVDRVENNQKWAGDITTRPSFSNQFTRGGHQTKPLALNQGEAEQRIVLSAGILRYLSTVRVTGWRGSPGTSSWREIRLAH